MVLVVVMKSCCGSPAASLVWWFGARWFGRWGWLRGEMFLGFPFYQQNRGRLMRADKSCAASLVSFFGAQWFARWGT